MGRLLWCDWRYSSRFANSVGRLSQSQTRYVLTQKFSSSLQFSWNLQVGRLWTYLSRWMLTRLRGNPLQQWQSMQAKSGVSKSGSLYFFIFYIQILVASSDWTFWRMWPDLYRRGQPIRSSMHFWHKEVLLQTRSYGPHLVGRVNIKVVIDLNFLWKLDWGLNQQSNALQLRRSRSVRLFALH
jgi:hypothetical protein